MCEDLSPPEVGSTIYTYWRENPIPKPGEEVTIPWGSTPMVCRIETAHASSGSIENRKLTATVLEHLERTA